MQPDSVNPAHNAKQGYENNQEEAGIQLVELFDQ
jgi:hypothetical protein